MPVPTEVLNEDIKQLNGEVHKLSIGQAELRTDVRNAIALGKWAGTTLVVLFLTSGVTAIIWGASLTTKVYGMESRINEKFQQIDTRFDKLEAKMDSRFDKLEASIARLIERAGPAAAK